MVSGRVEAPPSPRLRARRGGGVLGRLNRITPNGAATFKSLQAGAHTPHRSSLAGLVTDAAELARGLRRQ